MPKANKIIDGLKAAIAGNFSAVTLDGQRWLRIDNIEQTSSITVGSAVNNQTDQQTVAVTLNGNHAKLSVEGARRVARQINEWADAAEERNKKFPGKEILRYVVQAAAKAAGDASSLPPLNIGQSHWVSTTKKTFKPRTAKTGVRRKVAKPGKSK